ncbi:hydrogen peroxide-dependent heme synthase [Anatilimnocola floriformis]|uniref:hydrogen peroxide-dependent heme synthase n=1 Tax=Anatilimnocola floriformis TaxID=2948575 RepID=UPI0020C41C60|nr:hydrogen peroxide-dependent heme synthase [Anatilimnocola floriformis]
MSQGHGRPPGAHGPPPNIPISLEPTQGWHCTHLYYRFDRGVLAGMSAEARARGREELTAALDPAGPSASTRLQTSIVSGHKSDFGLMLMDPNPLKIDSVQQGLLATSLGPALIPTYSFVSITEISEYVSTVEQYGQRLIAEGDAEGSPVYQAKLKAYGDRLPMMNKQRLTPEFPPYPATCFYPMNKKRKVGENWFLLPFAERNRQMAEHARSGMEFAGKVSQLITVGLGLDDWEWGVTLWAKNPQYLTEIVYRMRFDEASARYAEFGPFYTSYVATPAEMLDHCRVK